MGGAVTSSANKLVLRLLRAAQKRTDNRACDELPAEEYDWSVPHALTAERTRRIEQGATQAAGGIARALASQLHEEIDVRVRQVRECYGSELAGAAQEAVWIAVAGRNGAVFAAAWAPRKGALAWVDKALGAEASDDAEGRELSMLERGILTDVMGRLTETALASAAGIRSAGGAGELLDAPPKVDDAASMCVVEFAAAGIDETAFALAVDSDAVEQAGEGAREGDRARAAERIRSCVHRVPVRTSAWLGEARLPVREILSLQPGDVLVLDGGAARPADLTAAGRTILRGAPVRCGGRYALRVTERCDTAPRGSQGGDAANSDGRTRR